MSWNPRVFFQIALALVLCLNSTGCIFLGAYPFVQDVPGPVRGIRVCDSQSQQDIAEAQVSLNAEWGSINQYSSDGNGIRWTSPKMEDSEEILRCGFLGTTDAKNTGLLTRDEKGVFSVGLQKRLVPGIGIASVCFADGPGYTGPFGKKHGESGYAAVVTAWAPGYKPLQIMYHDPLFAEFRCRGCEFNPDTGILTVELNRSPCPEKNTTLSEAPGELRSAKPDSRLPESY